MGNSKPDNKEFQIFVNSRPKKVAGPSITFEEVLSLAGHSPAPGELDLYDVTWKKGNEMDSLAPGGSVQLENGMKFDAGKSNRS
jgi:hypothetical protein